MTDAQTELAEQIDADPDLGSASRVRGRCNRLAKLIEEHAPATIVLNQFRLLTNSVIRAVQLEIKAREVKHRGEDTQSNVVAEETRPDFTLGIGDFKEEDFKDCVCPTRCTPLSWPSKEDIQAVRAFVHESDGDSWLAYTVARELRLPLATIHNVVHVSSELGIVKAHVVWLPGKKSRFCEECSTWNSDCDCQTETKSG